MKIDEFNCHKLKPLEREGLFKELLRELEEQYVSFDGDEDAQLELLRWLLYSLDEGDQDDAFGTEGWRHSLLGED